MRFKDSFLIFHLLLIVGLGCESPNSSPHGIEYLLASPSKLPRNWILTKKVTIEEIEKIISNQRYQGKYSKWLEFKKSILPSDELKHWRSGYDEQHGTAEGYCVIRDRIVIHIIYLYNISPITGGYSIKK